jgi:ATP-dependent DNA ligase
VAQLLENQYDITILDGELYSDELTFQEIMSVIKKSKTPPDPEMMAKIEYHVYDGFDTRRLDTPMKERQGLLNGMFAFASDGKFLREDTAVQQVDSWTAENEDDVSGYYDMFIQAGYEGAIVRDFSLLYKLNGRSNKLLKVKAFLDFEYRIIGAAECQGNDAGTVKWICDFGDGRTFTCRPKGTREMRRSWWINREEFMGKMLTVEFFEFTDDGLPRFPVGKGVRDYE